MIQGRETKIFQTLSQNIHCCVGPFGIVWNTRWKMKRRQEKRKKRQEKKRSSYVKHEQVNVA